MLLAKWKRKRFDIEEKRLFCVYPGLISAKSAAYFGCSDENLLG